MVLTPREPIRVTVRLRVMRRTPLVLLLLLAACGTPAVAPGAPPISDQAALTDGAAVTGTGTVVAVPGRPARFCGNPSSPAIGYRPGEEPAPTFCELGIDLVDLDLGSLPDPRIKNGATQDLITLTGVIRDGTVTVRTQQPPVDRDVRLVQEPPCPEPSGGWPAEGPGHNLPEVQMQTVFDYLDAHPTPFVSFQRPTTSTAIIGFAVRDDAERDAVETALRPTLGDALCVVDARRTEAELEAARQDPVLDPTPPGSEGQGYGGSMVLGDDLQGRVVVRTIWVTPDQRAAADRYPAGLVVFEPDLRPV